MKLNGYFHRTATAPKDAPVLVMLHPFPARHTIWQPIINELADLPLIIFAPDMRGYDGAPTPPAAEWSIAAMAKDVLETLAAHGVARNQELILMGSSMGGYINFELWRTCPDRIRQIYLLNTRANPDTPQQRANRAAIIERLAAECSEFFIATQPQMLMSEYSRENNPQLATQLIDMARTIPVAALQGTLHALATRPDSTPTLATITVPTIITVGTADTVTPPEVARAMLGGIFGSDLYELGDLGHLPMHESPDTLVKIIRETVHI